MFDDPAAAAVKEPLEVGDKVQAVSEIVPATRAAQVGTVEQVFPDTGVAKVSLHELAISVKLNMQDLKSDLN